eukprot:TRINITY_DN16549_c0_g7_i1.p1 TRINITY_DN16549_c0_g7~~TRINITY_DN16549_c0_g7_i1.p1  ORF type:complete len:961 (+),score=332.35 TRINITY_DN16549_c0_g7_i1:90-2972(+)
MQGGKPSYDVATALQAVACMLDQSAEGGLRQQAEKYLEGMVDAPETWRVWDALLDERHPAEVQTTAAVMLRRKCVRTALALDERTVCELTAGFMKRFQSTPHRAVRRQLGSGVAVLLSAQTDAAQTTLPDVVPYVMQAAGGSEQHLTQLLALLPIELGEVEPAVLLRLKGIYQAPHQDPNAPRTGDASPLLSSMVRHAQRVLDAFRSAVAGGHISLADGLAAFTAWLPFFPDADVLAVTPFLTESLARLYAHDAPPDLREACHETVRGVCAVIEKNGAEAPGTVDLAKMILAKAVEPYRALGAFPMPGGAGYDEFMASPLGDEAAMETLGAVGSAVMDAFVDGALPWVAEGSDGALLLSAVLYFAEHAEEGVAEAAHGFWHAARLSFKRPVGNRAARQQLLRQLEPCFGRLVAATLTRGKLSAGAPSSWGETDTYREKVATPLLRDVAALLTPKLYLERAVADLRAPRQDWAEVEVRLYAIQCLEILAGPEAWESVAAELMQFAGGLAAGTPPRVYSAFAKVLPRLTAFLSADINALTTGLRLCHFVLADGGAGAFLRVCSSCREALVEHRSETLSVLMLVLGASEPLVLEDQGKVSEGLGSVVWTFPAAEIPAVVAQIVQPLVDRCHAAYTQQQAPALLRTLTLLTSLLRPAHEWCTSAALETGNLDIPEAVAAAWVPVWPALWGILSVCLNQAVGEPLAVQASECLAELVRVVRCKLAKEHMGTLLDALLQAHQQHPHVCYFKVFSALAESLAHAGEPVPMLVAALSSAAGAVGGSDFSDPELLLALFNMLQAALKRGAMHRGRRIKSLLAPAVVEGFGGTCLAAATRALESDAVVDARVLVSALTMVVTFLAVPGNSGKAIVAGCAPSLLHGLILCAACKASECTTQLAKIFSALRKMHTEPFPAWVQQALANAQALTNGEKTAFLADITADGPDVVAGKVATNRLHRTAHSRAAQV